MIKRKKNILFILIVCLAFFLRFWKLDSTPPSPTWDEVAYGYNAYSMLHTGKDEYDVKLPVILRSYGDYKPALYSYLAIPSVAIFDLNTFAVRLPDALASVMGVIATFFLVRLIFKRNDIALLSAFFLAVSPWDIQFSRFSHEAAVAVTLNIFTVTLFLAGLKKHWLLLLSAFCFGLGFYSYQSEKLFLPLLGLMLSIIFFKEIIGIPKKYILLSALTVFLVVLPMILYIVKDTNALSRAKGTSIFSHQTEILDKSAKQLIIDRDNNNFIGLLAHNRRVIYTEVIIKNYLAHFDPNWLFIKGDIPRHHPPGMGIAYVWELPFILFGILELIRGKFLSRKYRLLLIGWFLIAPLPAAFTFDVPHAGRTMNILPVLQILTAIGAISVFAFLKTRISRFGYRLAILFIAFLFVVNFSYYLKQYFTKLDYKYSGQWQYGYKEAVSFVNANEYRYKKIIVSNQVPLDQSYMFFLFYLKYPPRLYQEERGVNNSFGKYEFRPINFEQDSKISKALIIGSSKDIPTEAGLVRKILLLSGEPIILLSESKD